MTFGPEGEGFEILRPHVRAMEALLLLHADHGQNLSTSAVRLVGSSRAGLYPAISAGILALSGSLHGGANQRVVEMLEDIRAAGGDTRLFLEKAKDRSDPFRLMGFGHRVYKNFDPRAQLIKEHARELLEEQGNPLLEIAMRLEAEALADDFFLKRGIYPNVDFYSGIIYRAIGFPSEMFTALFALGRLPGWLAQWREMIEDPKARIKRPRSIYTGYEKRDYVPVAIVDGRDPDSGGGSESRRRSRGSGFRRSGALPVSLAGPSANCGARLRGRSRSERARRPGRASLRTLGDLGGVPRGGLPA